MNLPPIACGVRRLLLDAIREQHRKDRAENRPIRLPVRFKLHPEHTLCLRYEMFFTEQLNFIRDNRFYGVEILEGAHVSIPMVLTADYEWVWL